MGCSQHGFTRVSRLVTLSDGTVPIAYCCMRPQLGRKAFLSFMSALAFRRNGSFQLLVFLFCFLQNRKIRISIFPECEEILVCLAAFAHVARQCGGACQTKVGQWIQSR